MSRCTPASGPWNPGVSEPEGCWIEFSGPHKQRINHGNMRVTVTPWNSFFGTSSSLCWFCWMMVNATLFSGSQRTSLSGFCFVGWLLAVVVGRCGWPTCLPRRVGGSEQLGCGTVAGNVLETVKCNGYGIRFGCVSIRS